MAKKKPSTVRATCTWCATVGEYQITAFQLVTLETTTYMLGYQYEYFCLHCKAFVVYPIDLEVFSMLKRAGVHHDLRMTVDEVAEIQARIHQPDLKLEDVLGWITDLLPTTDVGSNAIWSELDELSLPVPEIPDANIRRQTLEGPG